MKMPRVAALPLKAALLALMGLTLLSPSFADEDEFDSDTQPAAAPAGGGAAAASDPRYVWDLTTIFKDDAAWDAERQALLAEAPKLATLRDGFGRDAASLRTALDRVSAVNQRMRRLWTYARALASTDNRNPRNQERSGQARAVWGQVSSATAWMDGAIAALGADRIDALLRAEPGLARHRVRLQEALRQARHQLTPEAETALAALAPTLSATTQIRTLLVTTDIEWPTITVDGQPVKVDNIGYQRLRAHPDRAVRQQALTRSSRPTSASRAAWARRWRSAWKPAWPMRACAATPAPWPPAWPTTPSPRPPTARWWPRPTRPCPRCTGI